MVPRGPKWWDGVLDALIGAWNRLAYRKPVGDEGITRSMVPRWRRR